MDLFPPKLQGRAELSSLRTSDRFRIVVSPVNRESKVPIQGNYGAKVFSPFITHRDGSLTPSNGTESQAPIAIKTIADCDRREKCRKSPEEDRAGARVPENTNSDRKDRVKRSKGMSENLNGETMARKTFREATQAVSNSRADYWRSGDDARGSNPRQSEPHLDTSTFALAGDSAHNQAMVHWSGHNSSVSPSHTIRTGECMFPDVAVVINVQLVLVRKKQYLFKGLEESFAFLRTPVSERKRKNRSLLGEKKISICRELTLFLLFRLFKTHFRLALCGGGTAVCG